MALPAAAVAKDADDVAGDEAVVPVFEAVLVVESSALAFAGAADGIIPGAGLVL